MVTFNNLTKERKIEILSKAMELFGRLGYKKTSINDIAKEINVSKAMVFKYFKSKKNLYLYLVDYASDLIINGINSSSDSKVSDFFDRIEQTTLIKLRVLNQYPSLMSFLSSIYYERDLEVYEELSDYFKNLDHIRDDIVFSDLDLMKFKDGVDPHLVFKMLTRIGEGYSNTNNILDLEEIIKEFQEYLKVMKENFYKEEYLSN